MAKNPFKWLALAGGMALSAATSALAQDSGALIDLLTRKGIISDQEAEDLRAELLKEFAVNSPAGKLDLSSRIQRFTLAGDVRIRYQYDNEVANNFNAPASTGKNNDRSRYRYRFRFGPTVQLANNWIAGFRLETAAGSTSTNDDFGAAGSTNFAKDGNTAFVGQAWIEYLATNKFGIDRVNVRVGKHAHPYFTPGVNGFWIDTDINFEGFTEELLFTDRIGKGWALALRAGQYLLANNARVTDRTGGFLNDPSVLLMGQAEFSSTYIYENNPYGIRIAPAFAAFVAPEVTGTTLNQADTSATSNYDNLLTVILPAEYTFKFNNQPLAVYATYGLNLKGGKRANYLYSATPGADNAPVLTSAAGNPSSYNQMGNVGIRYGATRNPGDWQLTAEYRYVEPGAYTAILLDSDFNAGRTNGSGFIVSGVYNWTDAISSTVTFFHAENIDKNSSGSVGFHRADVLQVDLSARF
jgi:hypothetical protein